MSNPNPEPIPSSRDDLVVLQVNDGAASHRQEPETLDLSIKKPREPSLQIHPAKIGVPSQQLHVPSRNVSFTHTQQGLNQIKLITVLN